MAANLVYQAPYGDGHAKNYAEFLIDEEEDLTGLKVSIPGGMVDPAPGSIAYTPDLSAIYVRNSLGGWISAEEEDA